MTIVNLYSILLHREHNLTLENDLMNKPDPIGIAVTSPLHIQSCLSLAIPISPGDKNFAKLCFAAQLFSLAQKWVWACLDEDDRPTPVLRMPCSYANVLTMNLESDDVVGAMEIMKLMMQVRGFATYNNVVNIRISSFHSLMS